MKQMNSVYLEGGCMIDVKQIRNFVSCNFTDAVLNGELKNGKIDLNLKLDKNAYENDYIHIYNVDLEEIRKNPELVFNYLLEKYLENNTIIGAYYFANIKFQHTSIRKNSSAIKWLEITPDNI